MNTNLVAVQMELTNACSCSCAECPRELHMSRKVGMMDLDMAKAIIEDALAYKPDIGFNLNGLGEPMLYKHMPEVLQHIEDCGGARVDFFTSLKAPESLVNRVFDHIAAHPRLKVMLAMTKHLYTVHGKDNIDADSFERNFTKAISLPEHVDKNIAMIATKYHSHEDLHGFKETYAARIGHDKTHVIHNLNPWFNTVADMSHPDFGPTPPAGSPGVCDYPFILLHFGWDGTALVCCSDDIHGELQLGTFSQRGDIRRIWEGEAYRRLRDKHNAYDIDMAPCIHCERCAFSENYTGPKI